MATFSHLPVELVEHIWGYLEQSQLYCVSQLNQASYALTIPYLYRHVDLSTGDKLPRIDRFCFNLLRNGRLAAHVESLSVGPRAGLRLGQRSLPYDPSFNNELFTELATNLLGQGNIFLKTDLVRDAIDVREYAAFAVLILLAIPALHRIHLAEPISAPVDHMFDIFRSIGGGREWLYRRPPEALLRRLSSITSVSINVDKRDGICYPADWVRLELQPILNFSAIRELELSIPLRSIETSTHHPRLPNSRHILRAVVPTSITKLVFRTSLNALSDFGFLFASTPQLRSFTYEFFYDLDQQVSRREVINLQSWTDALPRTLVELVFSVEYCKIADYPFDQPRIEDQLLGFLDLTNFTCLQTLEVPLPFLTGDSDFSLSTEIYPLLPPNLSHLSLRTDLTHAQPLFCLDTSMQPRGLSFQQSADEARLQIDARMDLSYMFHAAMAILSFATKLKTYTIWQPADASLSWFDGQIDEFAQACRKKSINGHLLYPMLLRWKKPENWNLVKDVMVCHPDRPAGNYLHELCRGERAGIPLGLACQYHLQALRRRRVRYR